MDLSFFYRNPMSMTKPKYYRPPFLIKYMTLLVNDMTDMSTFLWRNVETKVDYKASSGCTRDLSIIDRKTDV